jgi:hypothetical protein
LANLKGHSQWGQRCLAVSFEGVQAERPARAGTATFILPEDLGMPEYELIASPTLYSGQSVRAGLSAAATNSESIAARLYLRYYDAEDRPALESGPPIRLAPGEYSTLAWSIPTIGAGPIYEIGIETRAMTENSKSVSGTVYLDFLGWDGAPEVSFSRPVSSQLPPPGPMLYRRAWVDAVDHWESLYRQTFRIIQDYGRGMISTGSREWTDYQVSATITSSKFVMGGIAARVQGLRRYYALLLVEDDILRLVKYLDDETVLAETPYHWEIWQPYQLTLAVDGDWVRGWVDGRLMFEVQDLQRPLLGGGVGLVLERGHMAAPTIAVSPL